jgi:hypothetical protein
MDKVSLTDLLGGAAVEAFDHELARVAENILDPNTLAAASREITLKVKIKPTPDRELGEVNINCSAKLAPSKPLATRIYFGRHKGMAVAIEHDPKQPKFPQVEEQKLKAVGGEKA